MNRSSFTMERIKSLSQRFAELAKGKRLTDLSALRRTASPSLMDWVRELWGSLGSPFSREGFSLMPITVDRIRQRRAMNSPGRK